MVQKLTLGRVRPSSPNRSRRLSSPRGRARVLRLTFACLIAVMIWSPAVPSAAAPNFALGKTEFDIDTYWREIFAADDLPYSSPAVLPLSSPVDSGCGYVTPDQYLAFYCLVDVVIYWSVPEYDQVYATTGDAAWVNVMAHEWSHHIQYLLGLNTVWRQTNDNVGLELEATCMGGSYVGSARAHGLVDDDMIAGMVAMFGGDQAHGTTAQVRAAFLNGVENGISGCGLIL